MVKTFCLIWKPENWAWDEFSEHQKQTSKGLPVTGLWDVSFLRSGSEFTKANLYIFREGWEPEDQLSSGLVASGFVQLEACVNPDTVAKGSESLIYQMVLEHIVDPTKDLFVSSEALGLIGFDPTNRKKAFHVKMMKKDAMCFGLEIDSPFLPKVQKLWQTCCSPFVEQLLPQVFQDEEGTSTLNIPVNRIFMGAPGTGKTHALIEKMQDYDSGASEPKSYSVVQNEKSSVSRTVTEHRYEMVVFHHNYSYEDFVEGLRPVVDQQTSLTTMGVKYEVKDGVFKKLCHRAQYDPSHRYALFIDELNRAPVLAVFGELLTLIEVDKRATYNASGKCIKGLEVVLPYSGERFGVPHNLDIYATMNSQDISIGSTLDKAFRRRFYFQRMKPTSHCIKGENGDGTVSASGGESINLKHLMDALNQRITLHLGKDFVIGQGYFMPLKHWDDVIAFLAEQLLPLLVDMCGYDVESLQLILMDIDHQQKPVQPFWLKLATTQQYEVFEKPFQYPSLLEPVMQFSSYPSHNNKMNNAKAVDWVEKDEITVSMIKKLCVPASHQSSSEKSKTIKTITD